MNRSLPMHARGPAVLVIDSLELRRAGVVSFLRTWADDCHVDIIQFDACDAIEQASDLLVRMILLVIGAQRVADPEPQGWIASLHDKYADVPLVLVSEREETDEVVAAFKAGVRGFVPMSITPPVAIQAFTFIMGGGSFYPPAALMQRTYVESTFRVSATRRLVGVGEQSRSGLTARQWEVLERLRQGESNKLIGRQLKLRESTVKVHIRQIMRKLGATNRTQAALCAAELSLTTHNKNDLNESDQTEH
jgi:DNA-binding NarL/FixJ family response regulator